MRLKVYTDASFCHKNKIAACGYVILNDYRMVQHEVVLMENIKTSSIAETYAALHALWECYRYPELTRVQLYTDNETVYEISNGKSKEGTVRRCKTYNALHETVVQYFEDGIDLIAIKVKGHASNHYNNKVDKSVRYELRKLISSDFKYIKMKCHMTGV